MSFSAGDSIPRENNLVGFCSLIHYTWLTIAVVCEKAVWFDNLHGSKVKETGDQWYVYSYINYNLNTYLVAT